MTGFAILLLLIGLALGAALGALWMRARQGTETARLSAELAHERRAAVERAAASREAETAMADRFRVLAGEALAQNNSSFLTIADRELKAAEEPIRRTLERLDGRLREIEESRVGAQAALARQITEVRETGERLRRETAALVTALRKPHVRGRWGEMHLRRAVETAGLVERCDFDLQATLPGLDGVQRPDMIVHLAGGKQIVVDAKVPLTAFLDAAESDDEEVRAERLRAHARHLRTHVDVLAAKAYWQRLPSAPEFVVLFVPGEAFLAQALDTEPELLEYAFSRRVVVATPTTLIALLRTVAFTWSQAALADSAREMFDLGRQLYTRLGGLGEHLDRLGRSLSSAVTAYNRTVGSLEARVLVSARKMRDLNVVDDEIPTPRQVDESPRTVSAPELVATAEEGRRIRAVPMPGDDVAPAERPHGPGRPTVPGSAVPEESAIPWAESGQSPGRAWAEPGERGT